MPLSGLWSQTDVGAISTHAQSVTLGDLDHDGDLDIASSSRGGTASEVVVWKNSGDPFSGLWTKYLMGTAEAHLQALALGDLNNDGDLDIVTGSSDTASYEVIAWENVEWQGIYLPLVLR
jgi:hypothetical protein